MRVFDGPKLLDESGVFVLLVRCCISRSRASRWIIYSGSRESRALDKCSGHRMLSMKSYEGAAQRESYIH